jgi:hypothetical protein
MTVGLIALGIILLIWVLTWDEQTDVSSPAEPGEQKHA